MAPNNRSHDDLMSLLHMDDDSSFANESITTTTSHSLYGGKPMCYSDRSGSSNSNKNDATNAKKMTAAAVSAAATTAAPGLRKRSGTPPAPSTSETDETTATTTTTASSAACGTALRTMFMGDKSNNQPGYNSEEGLDLAKYPIMKITVPFFLIVAFGTKFLGQNFPYVLAPWAAAHTYKPAHWHYDHDDTHFDNTAWTYGTDYWLTVAMVVLAARCLKATPSGRMFDPSATSSFQLRVRSAVLLILYGISTLAGGYAHHSYHGVDDLNTVGFRVLWTICVGTVTSAGAAMLWIGSELCKQYHANVCGSEIIFRIPTMPTWFCAAWGCYITGLCILGEISYKRPACDIFVAGTTQTFPTAYLVLLVAAHKWTGGRRTENQPTHACDRVQMKYRLVWYAGMLLNVPLLPAYPLMVQYTDWSLAAVNTLLHAWLTMSWGMQGIALRHFCMALGADGKKQAKA
mmetsp:Transcript_4936/g.14008  ORF Transcript_4936/g.14008 Transcript_4936/m.14008 type:complete len:460 (-) Transcript_4936:1733-3112(-)